MRSLRHTLKAMLIAYFALVMISPSIAQTYPNKPIKVVVPFPAGGPLDSFARQWGERLAKRLGQPIVVDNRSGAMGTVGADVVAKAAPDGLTLLIAPNETMINAKEMIDRLPYSLERDFIPISRLVRFPMVFVCNKDVVPAKTFREFVEYAKRNKGKISYGSWGAGSTPHLLGEALNRKYGLDALHVPYKGGAPVVQDLAGGQIACAFHASTAVVPFIEKGILVPYAVSGGARLHSLPTVPTMRDLGLTEPVFMTAMWYGLYAPAGTPPAVISTLSKSTREMLMTPDFVKWITEQDYDIEGTTPQEFSQILKYEESVVLKMLKQMNLPKL